jgi:hypothetical protein
MVLSRPQSKEEEATIVDLENGNETTPSASSLAVIEDDNAQTASPVPRQSLEYADNSPYQSRSYMGSKWKQVEGKLPQPIVRWTRKAIEWIKGPQPPVPYRINPLFERVQTFPTRLLSRLPKLARIALFVCAFMLWLVVFGVLISKRGLPSDIGGFGTPVRLACTSKLWSVLPWTFAMRSR